MKKQLLPLIVLSLIVAGLAGCASGSGSAGSAANAAGATGASGTITSDLLPTDYENALPLQLQLIFGTLKLDGTENEVDAETAKALLPLWKAARSLSSSDTAASQEVEAIYKQIEDTMTPAQVQAIAVMKLTRDDTMEIAQEMGLNIGLNGGGPGNLTAEQQATAEARRESGQGFPEGGIPGGAPPGGGIPGGGGPPGGGFPGGGAQGGGSSGGASGSGQSNNRPRSGFGNAFYDAVIQYLQEKAG